MMQEAGCRMHDAGGRIVCLLVFLSLTLLVAIPAAADNPIVVTDSRTIGEFPQALIFQLSATDSAADITKIELHFRLRGETSTEVGRPEFTPGRQVQATYRWQTDKMQVPPGAPVVFYWVIADRAGNTLTTDEQTAIYEDLRFPWQHYQNDEIAFYWYEGSDDFGRYVFVVAARSLARISTDLGVKVRYPIRIYAYANQDDFRSTFPSLGNTYQWIAGQAFPEQAITVQILPEEGEDTTWIHDVIPHEISHLVFHQATDHPLADPPAWLNEGLAMHNQEGDLSYWEYVVQEVVRKGGRLFSLKELSGWYFNDEEKARLAYAESYSAVEYIFKTYGREGMARLIAAFGAGKMREAAFQEAFGISLDELDRNWQLSVGATPATATPVLSPTATPERPWLNPTIPPWAQVTPTVAGTVSTPATPVAQAHTSTVVRVTNTPATPVGPVQPPTPPPTPSARPVPGYAPVWLAVFGGACSCSGLILVIILLGGLVWWRRRR